MSESCLCVTNVKYLTDENRLLEGRLSLCLDYIEFQSPGLQLHIEYRDIVAYGISEGTEEKGGPKLPSIQCFVSIQDDCEETAKHRFYHPYMDEIKRIDESLTSLIADYDQRNNVDSDMSWSGDEDMLEYTHESAINETEDHLKGVGSY